MSSVTTNGSAHAKDAVAGENRKVLQIDANPLTKNINDKNASITSDYGVKSNNTDDWLKVSTEDQTGPMLLEDNFSREKIHRFDHERIPERVVHARGAGAFGTFKLYESAQDVTSAGVLTDTSRTTPVFIRFSTVLGNRGSADTVRDARGFAVKFYTEEGNWDLVGNNIPVFFIQDALKFPDLVHAAKPEPHNEIPQAQSAHNNFWDFQYLHSEATHMFMWAMSDRGIPRSYRMMQGFGVNTYTLLNAAGERNFVKFHFKPDLGVHSLIWDEALKIAGQDPDFHRKDLFDAIAAGSFPKWKFGIQVIAESKEHDFDFDILDATKVWPESQIPVRYIGELELNRNPDEYFTQVEQIAFCTSHLPPGIGFSNDPLLQGRNFSYLDTQLSRLGINWQELPINRPLCPVMNHHRDGQGRHTTTKGRVNYWPNRFEATPPSKKEESYIDYPEKVAGMKQRLRSKKFREHIKHAQLFYNSLAPHEKAHLEAALCFELDHCDDPIVYENMSKRLTDIDLTLAQNVAKSVGAPVPQEQTTTNAGHTSKGLSQVDFAPLKPTIETRMVAILVADGFDPVAYNGMLRTLRQLKAMPFTIGPRRTAVHPAGSHNGSGAVYPDHHFEGMRSTLFDAVFIPGGVESIKSLSQMGRVIHWVREAFGHLKAIGATGEAVGFLSTAAMLPGIKLGENGSQVVESYGVVTAGEVQLQSFNNDSIEIAAGQTGFVEQFVYAISQHRNYDREMQGLSIQVAY